MKRIVLLIAVLALLMGGYIFKAPITAYADNLLYQSPCDTPITYRIGSIDPKYNLTEGTFINSINQASDIWSTTTNKKLFEYDPKGEIEINLVYDQRQFLSTQINDINSKVKAKQNELDPKIADYKKRATEFKAQASQLNNDIEFWNNKGGAPPDEYEKLKSRQANLIQVAESLKNEALSLNQSTDQYNQEVGQLHQTVSTFNTALQYQPEEGEYIYDNGKQTINIYFDNSDSELIHTLAHELGHALRISHNNNPESIMYPQTTEITGLSSEDKLGLQKSCEKISVIKTGAERLGLMINRFKASFSKNN